MNVCLVTMLLLCTLALSACSVDRKAAELFETARFEEKQHNVEHAVKLYEQIIKEFPNSKSASEARTRLDDLGNRTRN